MRISDWSSDVCSSDLPEYDLAEQRTARQVRPPDQDREHSAQTLSDDGRCKGEDERVYGYFPEVLASQQIGKVAQRDLLPVIVERAVYERLIEDGQKRRKNEQYRRNYDGPLNHARACDRKSTRLNSSH